MRAKAPRFALGIEECGFLKAYLHALWNSAAVRRGCDLPPTDFFVGNSFDRKPAVALNHIFGSGFDQMRRDPLALFDDALRRNRERATADHCAAAAESAGALLAHVCVAVQNGHVIHRSLHQLGGDLRP